MERIKQFQNSFFKEGVSSNLFTNSQKFQSDVFMFEKEEEIHLGRTEF